MRPSPKALEQEEKKQLQAVRDKFFDGRTDAGVPESRLFNRFVQDRELNKFKKSLINKERVLKDSKGNTVLNANTGEPIFLSNVDSRGNPTESVADRSNELARLYGPTFGQVMSDIGYGVGKTMKAVGIPFVSNAARLAGGLRDVYDYLTRTRSNKTPQVGTNFAIPKSNVKDFFGSMNSGIATSPAFVPPTFDNQKITREDLEPIQKPVSSFDNMDMSGFRADNVGLPSLIDLYNFSQNPEIQTNMGNFRFDNVFTGNPQLGYGNTVMINGVPVNLNATIGQQGLGLGASMNFKKGGPVDKYSGLGYKLK